MHEVQTFSFLVVPPPAGVRTDWMFGFQRRLVRRCEWDTLWPKPGPLPQTSHTLATGISWVDRDWSPDHSTPGNLTRVPDGRPGKPTGPWPGRMSYGGTRLSGRAGHYRLRGGAPLVRDRSGRPAATPARDRRAERLPGAGRRYRHQPGADRVGRLRGGDRRGHRHAGRGPATTQSRRAARRPRQLRRDPVAAVRGPRRGSGRGAGGRRAGPRPRPGPGRRAGL